MPAPILLGRTIPPAGLVIDIGRMIDYLWLKNKDDVNGIVASFTAIPLTPADGYYIRPNSGLDICGINMRYVFVQSMAYLGPPPPGPFVPDVDVIGINMSLGSLFESRGGSHKGADPYPFYIQETESVANNRRMQSLIPRRAIYCDWVTNSLGGDAGSDSPIYY